MPEFAKRRIGHTPLEVTVLGLGCATLGGTRIPVTRQEAEAIVRAAWDAGVRYVDAAPYDGIMRSHEDSLQRLGLARIDMLYVHDIGRYQHGEAHPGLMRTLRDSGYRALETLKGSGAVQAIGIGVNEREVLLEALEWGEWDAFLLACRYTLLEQAPLADLLPKCL